MSKNVTSQIDHLYRHEYGKIVSVLTKTFGSANLELAEDVTQDAMAEAIQQWSYNGVPENPVGWIYKVARFKAINLIRQDQYRKQVNPEIATALHQNASNPDDLIIFTDKEIADDQLRMIFTCCHPAISADSQIALTLKTLCGFSISEISSAFLTTDENINKRLVRARKGIRAEAISFDIPTGKELELRLSTVLEVIYLLFNEGYNSTSGSEVIRYELCEEALRLAEILAASDAISHKSSVYALLALMNFDSSRFASRVNDVYEIIDLKHQDRRLWNEEMIVKGLTYLELATQNNEVSLYLILATISAHHCTAKTFDSTDWPGILGLYDNLLELSNSPIIKLNRAVVLSQIKNPKDALSEIELLDNEPILEDYLPYYTAKAELQFLNKDTKAAIQTLQSTKKLNLNDKFKSLINNKINTYSK